jgi:hypothetical protein
MELTRKIRLLGVRKWYERELIDGHICLVTLFLALIMFAVGVELISAREPGGVLLHAALIGAGGWIGWHSWRRYTQVMLRADWVGAQASCPQCHHYPSRLGAGERERAGPCIGLVCRRCAHTWQIDPRDWHR